jgi:hypothetical protein
MWNDLDNWEHKNKAVVFMVVSTEEVRESLSYYNAFDVESEGTYDSEFICNINDVSETVVHEALLNAYNTLNFDYGITYTDINDACYDYIVENLSAKTKETTGLIRGQIYDSETKTFEPVADFMARVKGYKQLDLFEENNHAS